MTEIIHVLLTIIWLLVLFIGAPVLLARVLALVIDRYRERTKP